MSYGINELMIAIAIIYAISLLIKYNTIKEMFFDNGEVCKIIQPDEEQNIDCGVGSYMRGSFFDKSNGSFMIKCCIPPPPPPTCRKRP